MSDDSSTASWQTFDREKFIGGRRPPPLRRRSCHRRAQAPSTPPEQVIPMSTAPDPVEVTR